MPSLRKDMINKRVLAHQEEILPDIIAFNDALRDALKEIYDRTHSIWDNIKDNVWGDYVEVSAKCFLGYDYPELHPLQGEDREELWGAICDGRERDLSQSKRLLPSMASYIGSMYQYAFLAMLKKDFPEEYQTTKDR